MVELGSGVDDSRAPIDPDPPSAAPSPSSSQWSTNITAQGTARMLSSRRHATVDFGLASTAE